VIVILIVELPGLGVPVVFGAQVGGNRGIAAERQRCDDEQHDQDSSKASHAENPITHAFRRPA
jgi:hypothetical protein